MAEPYLDPAYEGLLAPELPAGSPPGPEALTPAEEFIADAPPMALPAPGTPNVDFKTLKANADVHAKALEQQFNNALKYFKTTLDTDYKIVSGKIQKLVPETSGGGSTQFADALPKSDGAPSGWKWVEVEPGNELQELYDRWQEQVALSANINNSAWRELNQLTGTGGAGGSGGGGGGSGGGGYGGGGGGGYLDAAEAYLAAEQLKTKEITRQYNDFASRADELYQLLEAEARMNMAADDQNMQNADQMLQTGQIMPYYGHWTLGNRPLSQILEPSLPDYVRPDYRLNQAVGLPGEQGFDDPDYDENGFPMYGFGTKPIFIDASRWRMRAPIGAAPWERRR